MQDFRDRMSFDEKTNLWTLDLNEEEIESLACLKTVPEVQVLNLARSNIKSLIDMPKLLNLQSLNLRSTQITSLEGVEKAPNLQELDLSDTKITGLAGLEILENLQSLNLSGTQISSLEGLESVLNLEVLDLSETQITSLAGLNKLENLQSLDLSGTQITSLSELENVENLQILYLSRTQITSLADLPKLSDLQVLSLFGTQIASLSGLENAENLRVLNLCYTQIARLDGLKKVPKLQSLFLRGSAISNLEGLENVKEMLILDLRRTLITSLNGIERLLNLKHLDISGLELHSIPKALVDLGLEFVFDEYFWRYDSGINLYNTTIATQPISLFEQPREFIEAYYDAEQVPVKESKVIFLGDGYVGKSYTIKRILNDGRRGEYDTKTTPGISISNYPAKGKNGDFTINFWDFGGQEIMHAMHRCFLTTRTCYVVVISNRIDLTSQARFWLKNIDSFAKGARVIIAVNKWDDTKDWPIDTRRLHEEFKDVIVDIIPYSAKNSDDVEFEKLINVIVDEAESLDSCSMNFPIQWANIRSDVLKKAEAQPYLDKDEYHEICDKYKLMSDKIRTWLLEWLNDLGVCFSYHQDKDDKSELAEYKVLDPKWLTNAIYKIINCDKDYVERGTLNKRTILDILQKSKNSVITDISYSEDERDYILEVMRKFNLAYAVTNKVEFIPALCESETPDELHPTSFKKHITYELKYVYLPDSVVHRLMIRCYQELNRDKLWRKGLRIDNERDGLTAVVDMGGSDSILCIDVYASGEVLPWIMLQYLRKNIVEINADLNLKAEDYIVVHKDSEAVEFKVDMVLAAKEHDDLSIPQYNDKLGYQHYKVDELLGMTFGVENVQKATAYAKENETDFRQAIHYTINNTYNNSNNTIHYQPSGEEIIKVLIEKQFETNDKLTQLLIDTLSNTGDTEVEQLGKKMKEDKGKKKNPFKRFVDFFNDTVKTADNVNKVAVFLTPIIPKIIDAAPEILDKIQALM